MAKNLPHYETGFGVYRSAQLTPYPFFFTTPSVQRPHYRRAYMVFRIYEIFLTNVQFNHKF
jgi:hypothetical protein